MHGNQEEASSIEVRVMEVGNSNHKLRRMFYEAWDGPAVVLARIMNCLSTILVYVTIASHPGPARPAGPGYEANVTLSTSK